MNNKTPMPAVGAERNCQPAALRRASGVLLHITSLPGKYGCGTLGREAAAFSDFLAASGQSYWQVLPVAPVCAHWHFSPYSSPSALAGNEMLIDPGKLHERGWLSAEQLRASEGEQSGDFADLAGAAARNASLLAKAMAHFDQRRDPGEQDAFNAFCSNQGHWLDDYSLFRALADHFNTMHWPDWPEAIARRQPAAMAGWRQELAATVRIRRFEQFVFFQQWLEMKAHANRMGVRLIGDIPFYVNFESADAWSHPEIFDLDKRSGLPAAVAGVPPDYFSPTGQRWGNPLYRWREGAGLHAPTVEWWTARVRHLLGLVDLLRIDHFRGFDTYWAIAAAEPTAVNGRWLPGPGRTFFDRLQENLAGLPLVAEDLGELTPGVEALRDSLGFPGMKILQFAFDGRSDNPYLPHNFASGNCLVYTGTHDNNTSNGWFYGPETSPGIKQYVLDYLGVSHRDEFHWQFIRLAMQSIAGLAIFPAQDILGYDGRFRMNTPGQGAGNWSWRLRPGALTPEIGQRLRSLTSLYHRLPAHG